MCWICTHKIGRSLFAPHFPAQHPLFIHRNIAFRVTLSVNSPHFFRLKFFFVGNGRAKKLSIVWAYLKVRPWNYIHKSVHRFGLGAVGGLMKVRRRQHRTVRSNCEKLRGAHRGGWDFLRRRRIGEECFLRGLTNPDFRSHCGFSYLCRHIKYKYTKKKDTLQLFILI